MQFPYKSEFQNLNQPKLVANSLQLVLIQFQFQFLSQLFNLGILLHH